MLFQDVVIFLHVLNFSKIPSKRLKVHFTDETVSRSDNLLSDLESFLFCFLLKICNKILEKSSILYAILQNRSTDFHMVIKNLENL